MRWFKSILTIFILSVIFVTNVHSENYIREHMESFYVNRYCKGESEVVLTDGTRCDCVEKNTVIEFDFSYKWYESVGQILHYMRITDKNGTVFIIADRKNPVELKHIDNLRKIAESNTPSFGVTVIPKKPEKEDFDQ